MTTLFAFLSLVELGLRLSKGSYRRSAQKEPSVIKEGGNAAEDFLGKKRKGHVHNLSNIGDKGL